MIVCSKCKKFVKYITYKINGLDEISDVHGECKTHGNTEVDWDDYEELVGFVSTDGYKQYELIETWKKEAGK